MATFLFTWNPTITPLDHYPEALETFRVTGINVGTWPCVANNQIVRGERFFLICLYPPNSLRSLGIAGSGWILGEKLFRAEDPETTAKGIYWLVDLCVDVFLDPYGSPSIFYDPILDVISKPYHPLNEQQSGLPIEPIHARDLEFHWATFLAKRGIRQHKDFAEVEELADELFEIFFGDEVGDGNKPATLGFGASSSYSKVTSPPVQLPPLLVSTYASTHLIPGSLYTRAQLMSLFNITDNTIRTGVFKPKDYDSIWLFVTKTKAAHLPQLHDQLEGDLLLWDGQNEGRTDNLIINHQANGHELLLFYRDHKDQYPEYAFRYEGPFDYLDHTGSRPTHFTLIRHKLNQSLAELEATAREDISAAEVETETIGHLEGARTAVLTNKYERNPKNRAAAILIHGTTCQACGFSFEQFYGPHGKDFIQVHHKKPLASYNGQVIINPATDLAVLCSNCHSMIHRYPQNPLSVEELASLITQAKSSKTSFR